jgi:isoleucyl-tRNA synthetase
MKEGAALITEWANDQIRKIENEGIAQLRIAGENFEIGVDDIEIFTEDIPGWLVSTDEEITVALDLKLDDELLTEGFARELINRVQNLRKTNDLNVTDKIITFVESHHN